MELTYQQLKTAIENLEKAIKLAESNSNSSFKWEKSFPDDIILLQAAKNYLPILFKQEFIKSNEITTDEYLGKNFK